MYHETSLSPPVKYFFTDRSKAMLLLGILFCYLCFVSIMLSRLFIAALWPPAGKGPTSYVMFSCVFVNFPGPGVVLDYIDSLSLPSFLLCSWL